MRDYEKYISRQLKRGTSRQELNVSWLKKNELDLKRHVTDLRENIRTNWTTTGQELSRELRQFWPAYAAAVGGGNSRPDSPARTPTPAPVLTGPAAAAAAAASSAGPSSPRSPTAATATPGNVNDFVTGYTLGLIGGVRSWVSAFSPSPKLPLPFFPAPCLSIYPEYLVSPLPRLPQQVTDTAGRSSRGRRTRVRFLLCLTRLALLT